MLNTDIYAIVTEIDERNRKICELFTSFDEAMSARHAYRNWCCNSGDVWIQLYPANTPFIRTHSWHIDTNGKIISEYNF